MKKIAFAIVGGVLGGAVLTTQVAGPLIAQETERKTSVYEQLDLFGDIFERIRAQYVEEVDEGALIEAAIDGMLTSLDPHSSYLSPQDADDMRVQTRGSFGGLGIEVTQEEGFVKVVSPIDDTPAGAAGVEAGDFITHVDGETVLGLTLDEAVERQAGLENGFRVDVCAATHGRFDSLVARIHRGNDGDPVFAHVRDAGDGHVRIHGIRQAEVQYDKVETFKTQARFRRHQRRCHDEIDLNA